MTKASRQPKDKLRSLEQVFNRIAEEEKADTYKALLNQIESKAEKFLRVVITPE